MIPQLVKRMMDTDSISKDEAVLQILAADPFDISLHMEQVWDAATPWGSGQPSAGKARKTLWDTGAFAPYGPPPGAMAWEHLAYSYVLENTRAVQIMRRVVREYRSGEGLGVPSMITQQWLDATEALVFGAANPMSLWQSTSSVRTDPEAVRRNAYWRMLGLDLAFGTPDNGPPSYDKAAAANTNFVSVFEELLFELWQAISNVRNTSGVNASDDDRIYRLAEALQFILRSRRQFQTLSREELAAATVMGWIELTLCVDTPIVIDLKANASSPADRLKLIGERVGLPAHGRCASFYSMAAELSLLLRTIESGLVSGPEYAWVLYLEQPPSGAQPNAPVPLGVEARRVITEWAASTGKDLKARGKSIDVERPRLTAVK